MTMSIRNLKQSRHVQVVLTGATLSSAALFGVYSGVLPDVPLHTVLAPIAGFFAVMTFYLTYRKCFSDSNNKSCRYEELGKLVKIGLECSEIVIQLGHMKQAVDTSSAQSQSMASAVEELVTSIKEISMRTQAVSGDTKTAESTALQGVKLSQDGMQSMRVISDTANQAAGEVRALADESSQIGEIVLQIKSIADQTNLLALNATIEAARAGEAGKGFAVVASEVKALATQTSRATEDIEHRISTLHGRISDIVKAMEQSISAVSDGRTVIEGLGRQLNEMSSQVGGVSSHMTEIAAILTQQTAASNDVSKGTGSIADLAQENTTEINAPLDQMDKLNDIVNGQIGSYVGLGKRAIVEIAKNDHVNFKKMITDILLGRKHMQAAQLPDHHLCRFGKWYDAVKDRSVTESAKFRALLEPHKRVHEIGREIVELHLQGRHEAALSKVKDLSDASHEVVMRLDQLAQDVEM